MGNSSLLEFLQLFQHAQSASSGTEAGIHPSEGEHFLTSTNIVEMRTSGQMHFDHACSGAGQWPHDTHCPQLGASGSHGMSFLDLGIGLFIWGPSYYLHSDMWLEEGGNLNHAFKWEAKHALPSLSALGEDLNLQRGGGSHG